MRHNFGFLFYLCLQNTIILNTKIQVLLIALCCLFSFKITAQTITLNGRITDQDTREGVPFCNVYIANTTTGTATDLEGYYTLPFDAALGDSLIVSAVGYDVARKKIATASEQTINFALTSASLDLQEVVVVAGENPANRIVRGIIKNKKQNRVEALDAYQCEQYQKIELDIENIPDELRQSQLLKPFDFVFENIDTVSDEKPFLPLYLNEVISDSYYMQGRGKPKNVVKAQRTSAVENNQSIIEFIKKIFDNFSVYDNWVYVLERPLASPFSNTGLFYYEYYIIDSTNIEGQWSYKLKFKPKRKQEPTFYGDFWVADSTFAIQHVNMRMSPDVNINLVNRVIVYQDFTYEHARWMPKKEKLVIDFIPQEGALGMIARKTSAYKDFQLDSERIRDTFPKLKTRYQLANIEEENPDYWDSARHEPLTETEAKVYAMVDSVQSIPMYKTYAAVMEGYFTGYLEFGNIEVGPWYSIYSGNLVEGNRFRLGIGTSDNWSKRLRFGGYAAFGTKDKRWKYGADFQYNIKREPRTIIGGEYKHDISLNSESSEDFVEGNLVSGAFRGGLIQKLIFVDEGKLFFEKHWGEGWSQRVTALHRRMDPLGRYLSEGRGFNYAYLPDANNPSRIDTTINTTELLLKTRYAYGERYVEGDFSRISVSSKYPIIELQYTLGAPVLGGDYSYHKLALSYRHYVYLNPFGWLSYRLRAGKTFGTVPFLLLEVHPGNEGIFFNENAFNSMNRYEFASDAYASIMLEHHFDGLFLNKIPLLRKLDWRELVSFKAVIGNLSEANRAANELNLFTFSEENTYTGFRSPTTEPYLEASVGLENIFKVIRIEALWRLNYLDNPQADRFGVRAGLDFYF